MRPYLSLDVRNVPASVEFYQKVFGVAPQKQTTDYAKFDLTAPRAELGARVVHWHGEYGEPSRHRSRICR